MILNKCVYCGKPLKPHANATQQYYCSPECGEKARRSKKNKAIQIEPFSFYCANDRCKKHVTVTEPGDKRTRFCCKSCEKSYWKHPHKVSNNTNWHSFAQYISYQTWSNE